jgi:hypothetical protein
MAIAGFNSLVTVATGASATYTNADGIISCGFDDGRDMLDITDLADSSIRRRIAGLRDISMSLSGDLEAADTGQARLAACYAAGAIAYVQYFPSASATTIGVMVACLVESKKINSDVGDKVTVEYSLQSEGSIDPVSIGTVF